MACKMLLNPAARLATAAGAILMLGGSSRAEDPFFVTYTSHMEERGTLEINSKNITGSPQGGYWFGAMALEFEYGATSWWTSELYLDGLTTRSQGTCFTGYRWENRFRPFRERHWINPVIYTEFENINGADRVLLEIEGHDGLEDLIAPVAELRREKIRELELKLILASYFKGWTLAENLIAVKVFSGGPWEFGYTIGIARPLSFKTRPGHCGLCAQAFDVGVEAYGGTGTNRSFGLQNTSHYVAPTVAWSPGHELTFRLSPNFGLTGDSARFLLRVGVSYEIEGFGPSVANFFRRLVR